MGLLCHRGESGPGPYWVFDPRLHGPASGSSSCYLTQVCTLQFHPKSGAVFLGSRGTEVIRSAIPWSPHQGSGSFQGSLAQRGPVTPLVPHSKPSGREQLEGRGLGHSSVISLGGSVSRFSRALSRFSTCTATTRHSSRPCRRDSERPHAQRRFPGSHLGVRRGWERTGGCRPCPHLPAGRGQ